MPIQKRTPSAQGEAHGQSKLTDAIVRKARKQVRDDRKAGKKGTISKLARKHKVEVATMSQAVHGRTWRHLPWPVKLPS